MSVKIIPSVMGTTQQELNQLYKKLQGVSKEVHFDVGDGKFVPTRVNWFEFKLSPQFTYSAHLMVNNPALWVRKHAQKFNAVIFHPKQAEYDRDVIRLIRQRGSKVGIALKPSTRVSFIRKYLELIDYVLILTVHPGYYGAKYLKTPLKKIEKIKRYAPNMKIIVDGGMKPATINDAVSAGADIIVSGSYVSGSENPKKAMRELKKSIS